MPNVVGLILGGGAGTRLQPLTTDRAKPAVPIAGKYRLVDIPISNCINSGIRSIYVLTQFNSGATEVAVKARGRAISRAVDVAEIVRKRFLPDVDVKDIKISTEQIESEQGTANVSAIEIILAKRE